MWDPEEKESAKARDQQRMTKEREEAGNIEECTLQRALQCRFGM